MRRLVLIGIGSGNPEHVTIQAINALNRVDAVLIPRKGADKHDLADLRREICKRYLTNVATKLVEFDLPVRNAGEPSYRKGVDDWHAAVAAAYARLLAEHTGEGASVALLVWGDPSLYDSTLRIVELLKRDAGTTIACEVIPGIASPQALAARHGIALNTIGGPFHVTTGRKLRNGLPDDVDSAVVMLDGDCSFLDLPGEAFDIYWGAYLGMADEIVVSGRLATVGEQIRALREAARQRKGWIMDIYLLRRR